jgi:hypothetical protein
VPTFVTGKQMLSGVHPARTLREAIVTAQMLVEQNAS